MDSVEVRSRFQARILESAMQAAELACMHLGDALGFYQELARHILTPPQLAKRTGTDVRYVREWLEQQAVAGYLEMEDADRPDRRRYRLPPALVPLLADRDSVDYMVPLASLGVAAAAPIAKTIEAFRTGAGVPYSAYGRSFVEGQAAQNRAMFMQLLGSTWLPGLPEVHARLQADPPARVADVGCGAAWSCIALAKAYPKVRVDGFDLDAASVRIARHNVAEARLQARVKVAKRDAADPAARGLYDLVLAFECIHDMSDPVGVLKAMRAMCKKDGSVLIMDERTGESPLHPGPMDRLFYAWSVLHCLPVGRDAEKSAATGTVMRAETLFGYAKKAGFRVMTVAPIENDFFRFYHLQP
jgi:2-polyprenyl-3-methyl-5-hydroxy-6-metoxy-1,4-benzoquinol methylase